MVAVLAFEPGRKDEARSAPRESSAGAPVARANSPESLQLPERRGLSQARGELFGAPPPPPQPVATAASAPVVQVAPPMPYRFAGRVRKGGEEEFLLSKGELVFPVKEGDTIDGTYKVVAVKPDGIELVYLPLGTTERIMVSSVLDVTPPALAAAPAPVADAKPAQLRWDGPKQVSAGGNFTVALHVSTQQPLRAAPMQLRYPPGVLEPVEVRPGKFIGNGSFSYRVSPDGSIFVGATTPSVAPGTDAELLIVTFKSLKAGATAEISMSALSLQGLAGRAIAHEQFASFRAPIQ
ncbi:MAG TPA: cohesin domain-containing protein [Burkholderiales bacterium]|nr:cohesin domain-containing protein [Burkholderiales bacterium]